jgi:hypothetical protein
MAYLLAELKDLGFALDTHTTAWAPSAPAARSLPVHFCILSLKPKAGDAASPGLVDESSGSDKGGEASQVQVEIDLTSQ